MIMLNDYIDTPPNSAPLVAWEKFTRGDEIFFSRFHFPPSVFLVPFKPSTFQEGLAFDKHRFPSSVS